MTCIELGDRPPAAYTPWATACPLDRCFVKFIDGVEAATLWETALSNNFKSIPDLVAVNGQQTGVRGLKP